MSTTTPANASDTYKDQIRTIVAPIVDREFTSAGVLVYPNDATQTVFYNDDSTVNYFTCTYDSKTWTLTMTTYDADGNVTLMTANDGGATGPWTSTLTYNSDNQVTSIGEWT